MPWPICSSDDISSPQILDLCLRLWPRLGKSNKRFTSVPGSSHRPHQSPVYECTVTVPWADQFAHPLASGQRQGRLSSLAGPLHLPRFVTSISALNQPGRYKSLLAVPEFLKTLRMTLSTTPGGTSHARHRSVISRASRVCGLSRSLSSDGHAAGLCRHRPADQLRSTSNRFFGSQQHEVNRRAKVQVEIALRLPALCGAPTQQEARRVLEVSVAEQRNHRSASPP